MPWQKSQWKTLLEFQRNSITGLHHLLPLRGKKDGQVEDRPYTLVVMSVCMEILQSKGFVLWIPLSRNFWATSVLCISMPRSPATSGDMGQLWLLVSLSFSWATVPGFPLCWRKGSAYVLACSAFACLWGPVGFERLGSWECCSLDLAFRVIWLPKAGSNRCRVTAVVAAAADFRFLRKKLLLGGRRILRRYLADNLRLFLKTQVHVTAAASAVCFIGGMFALYRCLYLCTSLVPVALSLQTLIH